MHKTYANQNGYKFRFPQNQNLVEALSVNKKARKDDD